MTMTEQTVSTGRAPGGMWWVAWRQHRVQLAIAVGLMAIGAVIMVIVRINFVADLTELGCTDALNGTQWVSCLRPDGSELYYDGFLSYRTWYSLVTAAGFGTPLVLGVFLGAAVFPREFEQGTHVFALSQSVSRLRWWAIKVTVLGVPLVVGLLVLGLLKEWMDAASVYTAFHSIGTEAFPTRSIIPAAFGLLVFAAAVAVGVFTRRTLVALVVSLIVGFGLMVALVSPLRGHLVPADRYTTPVADTYTATDLSADPLANDPDAWYVDSGYLDEDGNELGWSDVTRMGCNMGGVWDESKSDQENMEAFQQAWIDCLTDHGVVWNYTDIVPGTMVWPMRLIVTGIFLALSVLLLAAGAWRLRTAVAKR